MTIAEQELAGCPVCGSQLVMQRVGTRGDGRRVKKCAACGCGILDAELTPEVVASFYSESYFSTEHPAYFADLQKQAIDPGNLAQLILDRIEKCMPLKGKKLLDIGCAAGVLLAAARNRGAEVLGLEISDSAAAMAQKVFGLEVLVGRPEDHLLPEATFDVICMIDVIEHVLSPKADIGTVTRALKKGGLLVVMTPNFRAHRIFGGKWHGFHASYEHVLYFDSKSLRTLLESQGLTPVKTETFGMINLVEYYLPALARMLPGSAEQAATRVLSRGLNLFGCEHRLFMIARKGAA